MATKTVYGYTEPRLFTKPLRDLTPETSAGFDVIEFAAVVLGLRLFPWQEWLLIHALELNEDGTYRFKHVFVLVARQNGKTHLASILTAYWLWVDSGLWPTEAPAADFLILGAAQNLDLAEDVWNRAVSWGAPDEPSAGDEPGATGIPDLQALTRQPIRTNGRKSVSTINGATYKARPFTNSARGKSADRLLLDELREQRDFAGWSAISKTQQAKFNSQLWGISNAGGPSAIVLKHLRDKAIEKIGSAKSRVFIADWSADPDCALDDVEAYRQANPSMGYLPGLNIDDLLDDATSDPEWTTRTEVLCQWQSADVNPITDLTAWLECADADSELDPDSEVALSVDVSWDRSRTSVSIAGFRADGLPHVETIADRAGIRWSEDFIRDVCKANGIRKVALQPRGSAASELLKPLEAMSGIHVIEIQGPRLGEAAGQWKDKVAGRMVRHRSQPPLDMSVSGTTGAIVGAVEAFQRKGAAVNTAPTISGAQALWALTNPTGDEPPRSAYDEAAKAAAKAKAAGEKPAKPWWDRR